MQYTYFILCAFVFSFALNIIYFNKKHISSGETRIFSIMLVTNLFGLAIEFICSYLGYNFEVNSLISHIFTKIYLIYVFTFILLMTLYVYVICYIANNRYEYYKLLRKISLVIYGICSFIMLCLPITTYAGYAKGLSVSFVYIVSTISLFVWVIPFFKNRKKINMTKLIPTFLFVVFLSLISIIQKMIPNITLITAMEFLVIFIMYNTIENPDINMIQELRKNKILIEKGNEEKSNFLFKMTQEVKKPIDDIIRISNQLLNSDDIELKNQGIKYIETNARKLKILVNDVLDVSEMDTQNIKMINTNYNVYNLLKELFVKYQKEVTKGIEFRYHISENIPKILYGDSVKIKQIIVTILENAITHTKIGFIEVNVDSIIKNNVCRLIISIEDSGIGMSLDKVNELLSLSSNLNEDDINKLNDINLDLNIVNKIIKLLGGQIIIKSELGVGSEFIVTLEQKCDNDKESLDHLENYSQVPFNKPKVLVVTDKKDELNFISNFLTSRNIEVVRSMYGNDCIDRIKMLEKYDLIIMEDEMKPITGINTLQELQKLTNYKIPTIVLLDSNKEIIKNHYLNDGFNDYILKNNIEHDLEKIIKKYL